MTSIAAEMITHVPSNTKSEIRDTSLMCYCHRVALSSLLNLFNIFRWAGPVAQVVVLLTPRSLD